jgi:hypothetical protein
MIVLKGGVQGMRVEDESRHCCPAESGRTMIIGTKTLEARTEIFRLFLAFHIIFPTFPHYFTTVLAPAEGL